MGRDVRITLKRGRGALQVDYPAALAVDLTPSIPRAGDEAAALQAALAAPLATPTLAELAAGCTGEIAVVISDVTRPTPSARILPHILDQLGGTRPVVLVASGNHRAHTVAELAALTGGADVEVVDHDHRAADLVRVGVTRRGTPIELSRRYVNAGLRIIVGHVAFHPFAGYSGGAKLVVPGLASDATIVANHAMAQDPAAESGRLDGNPVREDLEEGLAMCSPHLAVHVVLDLDGSVAHAVTGDPTASHRAAVALHDRAYRPRIDRLADAAVVSAGGHPKDIDFRQSCKALEYAARGVVPGGALILVAACGEGVGSAAMEEMWRGASSAAELVGTIERDFPPGSQRVYPIAKLCRDRPVGLVSQLPDDTTRALFVEPIGDLQFRLDELAERGTRVLFVPATGVEPMMENA